MELNEDYLQRACEAFDAARETHMQPRSAVVAAIETYLAEMFKPGPMVTLEPLEAIPQRDYRKELWIAAFASEGRTDRANQALADFDKTFPAENPNG